MKKLIIVLFSLLVASCSHVKPTHKCNGDFICRCESCDKICKHGDNYCRKIFKAGCKCK